MNVSEVIEQLKQYDADVKVVIGHTYADKGILGDIASIDLGWLTKDGGWTNIDNYEHCKNDCLEKSVLIALYSFGS